MSRFPAIASDDNDRLRSVRAALSLYVGGALPPELIATVEAHGLPYDGWVFPSSAPVAGRFEDLSMDLADAGVVLREHAEALGVFLLVPGDPGWPSGPGADELPCLWVSEDPNLAGQLHRAVTVVGEQHASTAYGAYMASEVSAGLADADWSIVGSAGPDGIAAAVARSVRAAEGRLVLVAPHGHDQDRTSQFTGGTGESVTLVSAFPPASRATRGRFGVHHRLLGTLSAATVVIEAGREATCLTTVGAAVEAGRTVCAVPGAVTSSASRGCHELISAGAARLATSAAEVIAAVTTASPAPIR